jgi:hypothetical protein
MTPPPASNANPETVAKLIRFALFMGVAMFGVVTWFVHSQPGYRAEGDWGMLRIAVSVAMLAAVGGIFAARTFLARATNPVDAGARQMMGWAAGEFAAMLGGVYYFLTDDPRFYVIGMVLLLASFILLPFRRDFTHHGP